MMLTGKLFGLFSLKNNFAIKEYVYQHPNAAHNIPVGMSARIFLTYIFSGPPWWPSFSSFTNNIARILMACDGTLVQLFGLSPGKYKHFGFLFI